VSIKPHDIQELAQKIANEFRPERIILFGSHAYGPPDEGSDMDLLVVMPFEGKSGDKALEIMRKTKPRVPVDLVVRTPEDVRRRLAWNDFFLKEIIEKGKVLYESAHRNTSEEAHAFMRGRNRIP